MDVSVENHGSILLFRPRSSLGQEWIGDNVSDEATWWCGTLVVEHRYAGDLAQGMIADGLEVI